MLEEESIRDNEESKNDNRNIISSQIIIKSRGALPTDHAIYSSSSISSSSISHAKEVEESNSNSSSSNNNNNDDLMKINQSAIENKPNRIIKYLSSVPSRWKLLMIANDLFQVTTSVLDIVLDLIVLLQFYEGKMWIFFYSSLTIFAVAQLCYAFLFVATWARGTESILKRVAVFFLVLPFGQLVPLFTWIESFHFVYIDKFITYIGLKPTELPFSKESSQYQDADSLWQVIQSKYQSHAGFLAEAFVEAVPQSILQIIAMIAYQNASTVSLASILLSITVISSKGYLLSFSIHRISFIFNCICIAADVFCLFATFIWLFSSLPAENHEMHQYQNSVFHNPFAFLGSSTNDEVKNAPDLNIFVACVVFITLVVLCVAVLATVIFASMDDHLKYLMKGQDRWKGVLGIHEKTFYFDFYVVRTFAAFLAVIPLTVVVLGCRLTLLPIVFFGSLDPEHALHAKFYKHLFQFLHSGGESGVATRLNAANEVFSLAKQRRAKQQLYMSNSRDALKHWAKTLGKVKNIVFIPKSMREQQKGPSVDDEVAQAVDSMRNATTNAETDLMESAEMIRRRIRMINNRGDLDEKWDNLLNRSVILEWLMGVWRPYRDPWFGCCSLGWLFRVDSQVGIEDTTQTQQSYVPAKSVSSSASASASTSASTIKNSNATCSTATTGNINNNALSSSSLSNDQSEALALSRWEEIRKDDLVGKIIRIIGSIALFVVMACIFIMVPLSICLLFMVFFPLIQTIRYLVILTQSTSHDNSSYQMEHIIAVVLTSFWLFFIIILFILRQEVQRFQSLHRDLVPLKNMPPWFFEYGDIIIREIFNRWRYLVGRRRLFEHLETHTCGETASLMLELVGDRDAYV